MGRTHDKHKQCAKVPCVNGAENANDEQPSICKCQLDRTHDLSTAVRKERPCVNGAETPAYRTTTRSSEWDRQANPDTTKGNKTAAEQRKAKPAGARGRGKHRTEPEVGGFAKRMHRPGCMFQRWSHNVPHISTCTRWH